MIYKVIPTQGNQTATLACRDTPMENIKMEDLIETPTSEVIEHVQDPLKEELEKVTGGRTEEEKATFTFKKQAERLTALGIDPASLIGGTKALLQDDDDAPVTMGMFKQMQQQQTSKSALQMADDISNETERELVKYHLQNTIRSTGNPAKDLELASSLVSSVKNKQVLDELARRTPARTYSSNGGAVPRIEQEPELTREEQAFMRPPFNLSKEQVISARS